MYLNVFKIYLKYFLDFLCVQSICAGTSTGRFIMFSLITNIYNKKTKGSTLM